MLARVDQRDPCPSGRDDPLARDDERVTTRHVAQRPLGLVIEDGRRHPLAVGRLFLNRRERAKLLSVRIKLVNQQLDAERRSKLPAEIEDLRRVVHRATPSLDFGFFRG